MKPGPPPTPTRIKRLRGNPGKRPLNTREPEPPTEAPEVPAHLAREAKREWRRIVPELEALGILAQIDRAALSAYCTAWARWVDAEKKLKEYGVIVKAPSGYPIQSPYLGIANKAIEQMKAFLVEFGMTPSSRTRLGTPAKKEPAANPFAGLKVG